MSATTFLVFCKSCLQMCSTINIIRAIVALKDVEMSH